MSRPTKSSGSADRDELERWKRDINLTEYAAAKGYRIDRRESSRGSVVMRHPGTDDKVIIRREADGHWTYFSVRDGRDNGSIVDFVQRRAGGTLGGVRKELRSWEGSPSPVRPDDYVPTLVSPARDRAAVERAFSAARAVANSAYLNTRGIRPETLKLPRFAGTFRVDARGNVLFPHHDEEGLSGFEAKNHNWTSFAAGGLKTLWMSRTDVSDTKLVLVETAIDAISYHQLNPDPHTRYASTGGELRKDGQLALIRAAIEALPPNGTVGLAFDDDDGGRKLAATVDGLVGGVKFEREISPVPKDWNDALKTRERDFIASLTRGRGPDRGLT